MAQASQIRRALLHIVPPGQQARAAAVIHLSWSVSENGNRLRAATCRSSWGTSCSSSPIGREFDFLAGVDLRISLRRLDSIRNAGCSLNCGPCNGPSGRPNNRPAGDVASCRASNDGRRTRSR